MSIILSFLLPLHPVLCYNLYVLYVPTPHKSISTIGCTYSQASYPLLDPRLRMSLQNAGLDYIEIPYNPYNNKKMIEAHGVYINFLQLENYILLPTFELKEDDKAVRLFEELFKGQRVRTIASREISKDGGVLNCITWNIMV